MIRRDGRRKSMQLILRQPWTSIGSDGSAVSPDGPTGRTHPHPRYYGTFPRVLGRYARDLKVITLPEAVKKMTSMKAVRKASAAFRLVVTSARVNASELATIDRHR